MTVMMKNKNIISAVLFFVLAFSQSIYSQFLSESIIYKPEAEREFIESMKLFRTGKFDTASASFMHIIKEYPRSHRTTAAFIMGGKSYYEARRYR